MKKRLRARSILSCVLAVVTVLSAVIGPATVYAAEPEKKEVEYPTYDEVKDLLEEDEVVTFEDYEIEKGTAFDVKSDFTGIKIIDDNKVQVTFHEAKNEAGEDFSTAYADTYKAVYYVEPVSGNPSYQFQRNLIIKKTEETVHENEVQDQEDMQQNPEEPEQVATEKAIAEENGLLLFPFDYSKARSNGTVTLEQGKKIYYPSQLGNYYTCYFYVNGKIAYCLESAKATPDNGDYTSSILESNPSLQKALYYGYGGPMDMTGTYMPHFDEDMSYLFTHIAASYFYCGLDGFAGCTMEDLEDCGVLGWINYLESLPDPANPYLSFSETNLKAKYDGSRQVTGDTRLEGDNRNYITLKVPDQVTFYNRDSGQAQTGGEVQVFGGTNIGFSAPLTITGSWNTGEMYGDIRNIWKALVVSTGDYTQDIGSFFEEEWGEPVSFSVDWMERAKVKVIKVDSASNRRLQGAVFGIYRDNNCTDLIKTMPATNKAGESEVEIDMTQNTVYIKEITAPFGYRYNATAYGVKLVANQQSSITVPDIEQFGKLTVYKEGEMLVGASKDGNGLVFEYENKKLKGAVFDVYAAENILTAYGTLVYKQGDLVAKNLVTGDDGTVVLENLHLGKYTVTEVRAPENFYNNQISKDITISYAGQNADVAFANLTIYNDRQKAEVSVVKKDAETINTLTGGVFGLYAMEDIKNVDGNIIVAKDTLIEQVTTDTKGKAFFKADIPIGFSFYIKEIKAPENYLKSDEDIYKFRFTYTNDKQEKIVFTHTFLNQRVRATIALVKKDADNNTNEAQGDSTLKGATYGLYARKDIRHPDGKTGILYKSNERIGTITTDKDGVGEMNDLYLGEYFLKEITPPVGYLIDEKEYELNCSYEGGETAVVDRVCTVLETVKKQAFEIIKITTDGSSTETGLVKDAEFTVKLESDVKANGWEKAKVYDTLLTDAKGYAKSKELPYGTYHVKETKTPPDMHTTKDFYVTVSEDSRTPQVWRVFNDAPFKAYIRLIKKDAETGKVVQIGGTSFKIRDVKTGEDVSMKVGSEYISVFTTDETGMVTTPLTMLPGKYEVYEITAPLGYIVKTESVPFTVTSKGEYHTDEDGDFVIDVEIENTQQYGNVNLYKHGETLEKAEKEGGLLKMVKSLITGDTRDLEFTYKDQPIEGSKFHLVCDEDIYTADHQVDKQGNRILAQYQGVELKKGAVVASLITDKTGKAIVEKLPLGEYHIEETEASHGYVLNEAQDAFTLEYAGQDIDVVYYDSDFENERQKTALSLIKSSGKEEKVVEGATYGLYAKEKIIVADGKVLVEENTLIEAQVTDAEGKIIFQADLPLGLYYVKEIKAAPGYLLDKESYDVDFSYQGQDVKVITKILEVKDEPTITEFSKTDIVTGEEVIGAELSILNKSGDVVESWVSTKEKHIIYGLPAGAYILRETLAPIEQGYVKAEDVPFAIEENGKIQKVEMKDDYTKVSISKVDITDGTAEVEGAKLYILDKNNKVIESWVSTKEPHLIERLPVGTYTLLEEFAPKGYIIANKVTFEVEETGEVQPVVMEDAHAMGKIILNKTGKESEKAMQGVEFTIYDSDGKELETMVTDYAGHAESKHYPIATFKDGKYEQQLTYVVKETKTLDGYKLDETKHEVKFDYADDKTPVIEYTLDVTNEKIPETPDTPDTPSTPNKPNPTTTAPKTGDETNMVLMLLLMGVSAGSAVLFYWLKKRKK